MEQKNYDPFLIPPNLNICFDHQNATMIRPYSSDQTLCQCCSQPISTELYPLNVKLKSLTKQIGVGTIVFFKYLEVYKKMAMAIFIFYGFPSIITNVLSDYCVNSQHEQDEIELKCVDNYLTDSSFLNKWDNEQAKYIQGSFGILTAIILIIIEGSYKNIMKKKQVSSILKNALASDYTLVARHLPPGYYNVSQLEQEIKDYYYYQARKIKNKPDLEFQINIAYDLSEHLKIEKDIKLMKRQLAKLQFYQNNNDNKLPNEWDYFSYQQLKSQVKNALKKNNALKEEISQGVSFKTSSVAFISFKHIEQKIFFQLKCGYNVVQRRYYELKQTWFESCNNRNGALNIDNYVFNLSETSEPTDIMWGNCSFNKQLRYIMMLLVYLVTLLLIAVNFALIYYINESAELLDNNYIFDSRIRTIGVSVLISIVNRIIVTLVQYLGKQFYLLLYIKSPPVRYTYRSNNILNITDQYCISIQSLKQQTIFLNTVGLPIFVNLLILYIQQIVTKDQLFQALSGIMLSDMFYVGLGQSFITMIINYIDPVYLMLKLNRSRLISDSKTSLITQGEANKIFEGHQLLFHAQIAQANVLMWMNAFYAAILPQITLFVWIAMILNYIQQKHLLLRRYGKPIALGATIRNIYIQSTRIAIIFFGFGIALLQSSYQYDIFIFDNPNQVLNMQAILYFCPLAMIIIYLVLQYIYSIYTVNSKIQTYRDRQDKKTYFELKTTFLEDYDRENPYTRDKANQFLAAQQLINVGNTHNSKEIQQLDIDQKQNYDQFEQSQTE